MFRYELHLAGVSFRLTSPVPLLEPPEPARRLFRFGLPTLAADCRALGPEPAAVEVRLVDGDFPEWPAGPPVFDGGDGWRAYRLPSGERLFCLNPPASGDQPIWVARASPDIARVTVHCGAFLHRSTATGAAWQNPLRYPLDQILLMHALASRQGVILHAAGALCGGRGLVCCGRSGAGKSTLCRQWLADGRAGVFSDDRIVVRRAGAGYRAYGTPWPGELGLALNAGFDCGAICFLAHGRENRLIRLDPARVMERLLPVASVPWYDPGLIVQTLDILSGLSGSLPAWELQFVPDVSIAEFLAGFPAG